MKIGTKRGSTAAVLEAPEDSFSSGDAYSRPAPAGSLRRGYDAEDDDARSAAEERAGSSRRSGGTGGSRGSRQSKGLRVRFRGLPKTFGGRLVVGGALVLVLGTLGAIGLLVRQYLVHNDRFLLAGSDEIEILGSHQLTRAQALSVFANDLDRNIFHMSLSEREADLERLPWVQHATVMRLLPNRLRVSVVERTPVAFVRQGSQIGLVDATGILLDMPGDAAGDPQYSFPVLTGISAADPLSTRKARMELYSAFMKAMAAGGEQVTDNLSEVDVTDPEDVKAVVARDGSDILVHFGDENFLERYQTFEQHLPEWRQAYPKLVSADMRYYSQIVLNSGTAAAPAAVTATGPSAAEAAAAALAASGAAVAPKAATTPKPAAAPKKPAGPALAAKTGISPARPNASSAKPSAFIAKPQGPAVKKKIAGAHPAMLAKTAHPIKKTPVVAHPVVHPRPKAAHPAGGSQR